MKKKSLKKGHVREIQSEVFGSDELRHALALLHGPHSRSGIYYFFFFFYIFFFIFINFLTKNDEK